MSQTCYGLMPRPEEDQQRNFEKSSYSILGCGGVILDQD